MRTVVIVSPDASDIYFANQMKKHLNVVGVIVEQQYEPSRSPDRFRKLLRLLQSPRRLASRLADDRTMRTYFAKTRAIDTARFGEEAFHLAENEGCTVIRTDGVRRINDPKWVRQIAALDPDVIVVCGSSILEEPLLSIPPRGVLNLHGGLAQFYRGVWTTLWAVYNAEPEKVGCTVHFVSRGIDDGDIVYQGRPEIEAGDDEETLYTKVVRLGCSLMIQAVSDIEHNAVKRHALGAKGKLYLSKRVTPDVIRGVQRRVREGVIRDYLRDKEERDRKVVEVLEATGAG